MNTVPLCADLHCDLVKGLQDAGGLLQSLPLLLAERSHRCVDDRQCCDNRILRFQDSLDHMECRIPPGDTLLFELQLCHRHLPLGGFQFLGGCCASVEKFHYGLYFIHSGLYSPQSISHKQIYGVSQAWMVCLFQQLNGFCYIGCIICDTTHNFVLHPPLSCHSVELFSQVF